MRRIAPSDVLTLFFLIGLGLLTLFFRGQIPLWHSLLLRYTILLGLLFLLILSSERQIMGKGGAFLHHFSPILFVIVIYQSLGDLIQHLHPADIDPLLIRIDAFIFGIHPTVWMEQWIHPWLTDIMSFAYASYYFLPVIFIVILYLKRRMTEFNMSVFVLTFAYYVSFVGYIFFPAVGPRFTLVHLQSIPLEGSLLTDLVRDTLNALEHTKWDCMPSGHTQIVLIVLYLTHRYERFLFHLFFPIICGLIFSTVYLRYHYVVDLLGGAALAVGCVIIAPPLYRRWHRFHGDAGSHPNY
jgi:membrane-associated phospholipid phosphatase